MPDETESKPDSLVPVPAAPIDRTAADAIEPDPIQPDPIQDEIDRLEREAAPRPKLCPHCGKEIPRE